MRSLVERHLVETESAVAARLLESWDIEVLEFVKVMPTDYRRILEATRQAEAEGRSVDEAVMEAAPMGKPTGFMEHGRRLPRRRPVSVRLRDWKEVYEPFDEEATKEQGRRCMDCGIPFCHDGCPLGNLIPEWNDLVYRDDWPDAMERLHATNNFPEFTGRLCPAPCEAACVLGINDDPVTIERIEYEIVERAWDEGWVTPQMPTARTGQVGGGGRARGPPAGRRPAAGAGRARGDRVRTGGEAGRAPPLRHPRVQNGEGGAGPPPGPDGGGGRHLRVLHVGRRLRRCRGSAAEPGEERGSARRAPPTSGCGRRPTSGPSSTPWSWPAGRRCPGTCRCPAATCRAYTWRSNT